MGLSHLLDIKNPRPMERRLFPSVRWNVERLTNSTSRIISMHPRATASHDRLTVGVLQRPSCMYWAVARPCRHYRVNLIDDRQATGRAVQICLIKSTCRIFANTWNILVLGYIACMMTRSSQRISWRDDEYHSTSAQADDMIVIHPARVTSEVESIGAVRSR
jgi:hypothetical protein